MPPLLVVAAAGLLVALAGCEVKEDEGDLVNGKRLFVQKCGSCHILARANAKGTTGPNLDQAFQRALKDGFKRDTIRGVTEKQILYPNIKGVMPAREKYSKIVGLWQTEAGPLNEVVHVWVFKDLNERAAARGMGALISSSIELYEHQIEVARRVLDDPVQRYLLADEVGLGKTIEAGLIMLDVDYFSSHHALIESRKSSPYEINLGWAVSATKGPFNGRRALMAERARGPAWGFVGLEVDWPSFERLFAAHHLPPHLATIPWRASAPVYHDRGQVGYATSGCWSPLLKKSLALAHLRAPPFAPGTAVELEITVEHRRERARATVCKLPFFDPERKKA